LQCRVSLWQLQPVELKRDPRKTGWRIATSQEEIIMQASPSPKKIGGLLRAIDGYNGSFVTKYALQLAPLLLCVPVN